MIYLSQYVTRLKIHVNRFIIRHTDCATITLVMLNMYAQHFELRWSTFLFTFCEAIPVCTDLLSSYLVENVNMRKK